VISSNPNGYAETDMASPFYLAIDGNDDLWVANSGGDTISEYNTSGTDLFDSPAANPGELNYPAGIAVDGTGNVWAANVGSLSPADYTGDSITELPVSGGMPGTAKPITGGGLNGPYAIAVDHGGNIWVSNVGALNSDTDDYTGTSISEFSAMGVPGTPVTGGGLSGPDGIAIDGGGNVWVANYGTPPYSLTEVSIIGGNATAVSPGTGYTGEVAASPFGPVLTNPLGIAIDGSGNVWVVNLTNGTTTPDNVVEFVGAAVPVVTPLAAGVKNGTLGTTP
jgi:sugar lactone lactonase YvrE